MPRRRWAAALSSYGWWLRAAVKALAAAGLLAAGAALAGTATLTWTPPTQNTDGSPLTDLTSYRAQWGCGTAAGYPLAATIPAPASSYVVAGLADDGSTCRFVVVAINSAHIESAYSNEVTKTMPIARPPSPTAAPAVTWTISAAAPLFSFNFRSSAAYVTDAQGETFVNGVWPFDATRAWGWRGPVQTANRSTAIAQLAGTNYTTTAYGSEAFEVDFQPGPTRIRLAAGDAAMPTSVGFEIWELGTGRKIRDYAEALTAAGRFVDALGLTWSAAQWKANNQPLDVTLAGTGILVVLKAPALTGTCSIAHLEISRL